MRSIIMNLLQLAGAVTVDFKLGQQPFTEMVLVTGLTYSKMLLLQQCINDHAPMEIKYIVIFGFDESHPNLRNKGRIHLEAPSDEW